MLIDTVLNPPTNKDILLAVESSQSDMVTLKNKLNALITAYTALCAELNADSGTSNTDYGTGAEAPPSLLP